MEQDNNYKWAKAALLSYRYLKYICGAIDKMIRQTAEESFYSAQKTFHFYSAMSTYQKITKLTNKKIDYINLKIVIEEALQSIDETSAKILVLKYVHRMTAKEMSNLLGLPLRSIFRRVIKAFEKFAEIMSELNYGKEKMEKFFINDEILGTIYKNTNYYNDIVYLPKEGDFAIVLNKYGLSLNG